MVKDAATYKAYILRFDLCNVKIHETMATQL